MKLVIDKILNLDDGEHRLHFECKAGEIDLAKTDFEGNEVFPNILKTDVVMTKTGHTFYIHINAATIAHLVCDRCLTDVNQEIAGSLAVIYANNKHHNGIADDEELRQIDIRQHNSIGIDKDVRDMLILALPAKTLCRPDCRGLCAQCGADLNAGTCEHEAEEPAGILA